MTLSFCLVARFSCPACSHNALSAIQVGVAARRLEAGAHLQLITVGQVWNVVLKPQKLWLFLLFVSH